MIQERAYQTNIASEVVKRNTLVVLPTALGKTVIAALAAAHFIYNHRGRKVLVMAPTRPLVLQHRDTFTRLLKLKREDVEILTGRFPPNYRMNVWNGQARLYFATPQVVHNDSDRGLSLKDFSLLVFDECHRARKNYSYTKVAQAYVRDSPYPMILGMTASPGAEREKIEEICRALFIEHVETRTEDDGDVKPYVSPVAVEWKFTGLPDSYGPVREAIKKALERRLTSLASMGVIRKHPRYIFRKDLVAAGEQLIRRLKAGPRNRGMLFGALGMQSSALTLYHALELLESQGPHTFRDFLERVRRSEKRSHKGVVKELESEGVFGVLGSLEDHPKMRMLEELVLGQLSDKKSKVMVFTQYRATAAAIVSRFLEMGVSARKFVGQADREDEAGMSQEEQATALERFRDGGFNVLVATSIGEEGLDIPNVDLVLFYEPVPSEIRYIQRKGRTGRGSFGKVVILAAEGTLDASYLKSSKRMAERMKVVMKKLNSELGPVLRAGQPPEMDRMLPGDISTEGPPEPVADVEEEFEVVRMRQREFGRETRKVAEELLEKTLKCGRKGLSLEEIDERGMSGTVKEAVDRLVAEEQVKVVGGRLLPHGVAEPSSHGSHVFEVEKVMRGEAILLVDDKWRAVLTPEAYNGPRQLLKKGSRFSAASELYRQDGVLHAKIWAVEKTFS
jgi:Fanconi anemia group M protein